MHAYKFAHCLPSEALANAAVKTISLVSTSRFHITHGCNIRNDRNQKHVACMLGELLLPAGKIFRVCPGSVQTSLVLGLRYMCCWCAHVQSLPLLRSRLPFHSVRRGPEQTSHYYLQLLLLMPPISKQLRPFLQTRFMFIAVEWNRSLVPMSVFPNVTEFECDAK